MSFGQSSLSRLFLKLERLVRISTSTSAPGLRALTTSWTSLFGDVPVSATVTAPNGDVFPLSFSKISLGHYQARIPQPAPGTYKARISLLDATLPEVAWEVSAETVGERPHSEPHRTLLEQIASLTGGKVDPIASDLTTSTVEASQGEPLAHLFSILALALFFAEVLTREFGSRLLRRRAA